LKQRLRETVLEEGDDWRQRLRQVEEKNRVLEDKLQVKKHSLQSNKQQHKKEIEDLTSKFNSQIEKEQDKHGKEKSKMEKELKGLRKRAEKAELDLIKAESLRTSSAANNSTGEAYFQDILGNLKEFLDGQLQCTICSEIYVFPTSLNCGHSFCEDCIQNWRKKQANTTCPICRADVVMLSSNQVLDGFIEKFIDNFFPEDAKQQRGELVKERKQKKEARANAPADPVLSAGTRRRILNLDSENGSDDSWDGALAALGAQPGDMVWQLAADRLRASSPSNSSITSVGSTVSGNMSLTPERSPFFSESDDSYQPGQDVADFDLSNLEELDHQYAGESDRFSNEDHEDFEEDEEADDNDLDEDTSTSDEVGDTDQYDSPTFSDSD